MSKPGDTNLDHVELEADYQAAISRTDLSEVIRAAQALRLHDMRNEGNEEN